ncbi:MAG TPA: STAS domain-containing protein [Streptosporangiaceae bacterium]|nr:STAS domain-containing protein [Streptosporangiaceae bacterium]
MRSCCMLPEFTDRVRHGCVIVKVRGEIDLGSARILGRHLSLVLTRQAPATILDLSGLVFLDCAGLRVLLSASRQAAAHGGSLVLAAPRPVVVTLLQLTGSDQHLAMFPTVAEALTAHRTRPGAEDRPRADPARCPGPGAR